MVDIIMSVDMNEYAWLLLYRRCDGIEFSWIQIGYALIYKVATHQESAP